MFNKFYELTHPDFKQKVYILGTRHDYPGNFNGNSILKGIPKYVQDIINKSKVFLSEATINTKQDIIQYNEELFVKKELSNYDNINKFDIYLIKKIIYNQIDKSSKNYNLIKSFIKHSSDSNINDITNTEQLVNEFVDKIDPYYLCNIIYSIGLEDGIDNYIINQLNNRDDVIIHPLNDTLKNHQNLIVNVNNDDENFIYSNKYDDKYKIHYCINYLLDRTESVFANNIFSMDLFKDFTHEEICLANTFLNGYPCQLLFNHDNEIIDKILHLRKNINPGFIIEGDYHSVRYNSKYIHSPILSKSDDILIKNFLNNFSSEYNESNILEHFCNLLKEVRYTEKAIDEFKRDVVPLFDEGFYYKVQGIVDKIVDSINTFELEKDFNLKTLFNMLTVSIENIVYYIKYENKEKVSTSEVLYPNKEQSFLYERNKVWVSKLWQLLQKYKDEENIFIIGGVNHLYTEYGILELLSRSGFSIVDPLNLDNDLHYSKENITGYSFIKSKGNDFASSEALKMLAFSSLKRQISSNLNLEEKIIFSNFKNYNLKSNKNVTYNAKQKNDIVLKL